MVIFIVCAAIVVVLLLLAVAGALAFRRRVLGVSLPKTRGSLAVTGVQAPVTVGRDQYGVPHIDASSMTDAAFAMGVVHAQDRLWQMEFVRRVAAGRVSEFAGADGVAMDRFMRRLGLLRVAAEEARRSSAEVRAMLDAYAAGVNSVIESSRRLPLEFRLLDLEPEAWTPAHSLAVVKLLALGFGMNWDTELQRLRLLRLIGPERAAQLEVVYPEANPTTLESTARAVPAGAAAWATLPGYAEAARWVPSFRGGSNAWVLSGARTATGRPLLCNDPHMAPGVPSLWYAAHVRAGTDFEATGVAPPGVPFVLIGHNRRCAWGLTNSFADCQDLVIEEFDGPAAVRFRTGRGFERTGMVREVIHVKGQSDVVEDVVVTRHGPIVQRMNDPDHNVWRGLALQWTALMPGTFGAGLLQLQRAGDWRAFREAMAALDAPSHSAVYADVEGHIGFVVGGRIPVRRRRPTGVPVAGWTDDAQWIRFLEPEEMPALYDPPSGQIVTANNRVAGDDFPSYIASDYANGYRAARIEELLDLAEVDAGHAGRMQMDLLSIPARQVVRLMRGLTCASPVAERLRRRLAEWDAVMSPSAVEPTIYEAFMRQLAERALRPLCGDAWAVAAGYDLEHPVFDYPGNVVGRFVPELLSRWERADTAILRGGTWAQTASDALDDTWRHLCDHLGRSSRRWRWGRVHALPLEHAFSRRRPVGLFFGARLLRVGGSADTVMATAYVPSDPYRARLLAPSWRQIFDVGNWDACTGILSPGQSGQPGSGHYRDLVRRWSVNRQFPLHWSRDRVQHHARSTLTLTPVAMAGAQGRARAA